MANLNKYMFREYDIRGHETPEELNVDSVTLIAKSYGTFLRKRNITTAVVGHDNRKTSEDFHAASIAGLRATGINVIDIGMCLSPMMYWAQYYCKSEGGLIVTASHNPVGWNGVKLAYGYSYTLGTEELQEILEVANSEQFSTGEGTLTKQDIAQPWMDDLLSRVQLGKKLKIVLNTANATSGAFSPDVFRKFGLEVIEHNTDLDPSYPHYVPNPANVEMMDDTGKQVVLHGADVGVAIDADGDRVGLTDEKGQTIWPDRFMILLARQLLEKKAGSKIIFDVKVSESLPEDIAAHGGIPIMWKTGHSHIKKKMHEEQALLAGELSGHIFFADNFYGFDDANYAALKLLEYISNQNEPLSEIMAKTPYYISTPAYHAHVGDEIKYGIVDKLVAEFKEEGYKVVDINGGRVYMHGGWGLIRASSNLPVVVLRFEAKTEEDLKKIEAVFKEKLKKFPEVSTEWESA